MLCLVLVVFMRFLNLAVPILYKHLVDKLAAASKHEGGGGSGASFSDLVNPWVLLYLGAVFFQGGAGGGIVGAINNLRTFLWIPIAQVCALLCACGDKWQSPHARGEYSSVLAYIYSNVMSVHRRRVLVPKICYIELTPFYEFVTYSFCCIDARARGCIGASI